MAQICSIQVKSIAISRISVSPSYTLSQAQTHLCTLQGMLQSPDTEYSPAALIKDSRAGPNTAAPRWLSKGCEGKSGRQGSQRVGPVTCIHPYSTAQARARANGLSSSTALTGGGDPWKLIPNLIQGTAMWQQKWPWPPSSGPEGEGRRDRMDTAILVTNSDL